MLSRQFVLGSKAGECLDNFDQECRYLFAYIICNDCSVISVQIRRKQFSCDAFQTLDSLRQSVWRKPIYDCRGEFFGNFRFV